MPDKPLDISHRIITRRDTGVLCFRFVFLLESNRLVYRILFRLSLGDIDRDGEVNFFDIAPFIEVLSNNGFQAEADVDQNGVVNFFDISPFITLLSS